MNHLVASALLLTLPLMSACSDTNAPISQDAASAPAPAEPAPTDFPPVEPPAPGEPGGLADDRTPISEAPFTPDSAQGAGMVVQTYHALLSSGRYGEAWRLWADDGAASGMSEAEFAASFDKYHQYDAQIGAPGAIEGAAGTLWVEVPVVIYGRLTNGSPVHMNGPIRLRRCNDVPGCTDAQRQWRIAESGVRPRPGG